MRYCLAAIVLCACGGQPAAPVAAKAAETCSDLVSCEHACLATGSSCAQAADFMRRAPLETNADRYLAVVDAGCIANDGVSCLALGRMLTDSPALPVDKERTHRAFTRACELGEGIGCFDAAGDDAFGDKAAVLRTQLKKSCSAGDGRSCGVLGALVLAIDQDKAAFMTYTVQSADLIAKKCLEGTISECAFAAHAMAEPPLTPDVPRIQRVLKVGCDAGDGETCYTAGQIDGIPDAQKAELYERACKLDRAAPCYVLAVTSDNADAFQHALSLAIAACNLGDAPGCKIVASSLVTDYLSAPQIAQVDAMSQRACDRGTLDICHQLAQALDRGPEARRNPARTAALEDGACKAGFKPACQ